MEDGLVCLFSGSIVLVPSVSSLEGAAVRNQMPRRMEKPSSKLLPEEGKSQWVKCWKCGAWIHCRKCLTHHLYNTPHKKGTFSLACAWRSSARPMSGSAVEVG